MGGGARPTSAPGRGSSLRPFLSHRVFVSAMFTLLFLATLSVLLSTSPASLQSQASESGAVRTYVSRTFLALQSDPMKTRLDLVNKQAADHVALINAYTAYARKLKLDNAKQLKLFEDLVHAFADLTARDAPLDEDALRLFEKEAKDRIKVARQLIAETKESFDNQVKIQKLKDTIFAVNEQLNKAKKNGDVSSLISAKSIPKSLHCLAMRLVEERVVHPDKYADVGASSAAFDDPALYHYVIFSENVIATSVVVNSAAKNAEEPWKHVFHIVTDRMMLAAMQVWYKMRPPIGGAYVEIKAVDDLGLFSASEKPTLKELRFYLPQLFPKLRQILFLEDDVVVQRDLTGLWSVNLEGKVNGAVEICFGSFRRYRQYLNFSNPIVAEKFNPKACAWAFGVNMFDLETWRRDKCTERYNDWQTLNSNGTLWKSGVLPLGLATFYGMTKPLDKSWHMIGLGHNPSLSMEEISNAAVIHFNGNMKPWLDIAINQYKQLWTKYVDYEMEFVQVCNFGL